MTPATYLLQARALRTALVAEGRALEALAEQSARWGLCDRWAARVVRVRCATLEQANEAEVRRIAQATRTLWKKYAAILPTVGGMQ